MLVVPRMDVSACSNGPDAGLLTSLVHNRTQICSINL